MDIVCPWCHGLGRIYVERGSSLCYTCPDCDGTGEIEEREACESCGAMFNPDDLEDGLCAGCREEENNNEEE